MNNGGPSREEREEGRESALPLEDVSRLVELVRESGVGELSVRQGELEVTVRARPEPAAAPAARPRPPDEGARLKCPNGSKPSSSGVVPPATPRR